MPKCLLACIFAIILGGGVGHSTTVALTGPCEASNVLEMSGYDPMPRNLVCNPTTGFYGLLIQYGFEFDCDSGTFSQCAVCFNTRLWKYDFNENDPDESKWVRVMDANSDPFWYACNTHNDCFIAWTYNNLAFARSYKLVYTLDRCGVGGNPFLVSEITFGTPLSAP